MTETLLLERITVDPQVFGGKPSLRGRRLAVEHVLGMLAAGDRVDDLVKAYPGGSLRSDAHELVDRMEPAEAKVEASWSRAGASN